MQCLLRLIGIILVATLVQGNSQCQQNDSGSTANNGPAFVTSLTLEDANGNPTTQFSQGQTIQFAISVRNRSDQPLVVLVYSCMPPAQVAVVSAGTSNVVYYGETPAGPICEWVTTTGVPMTIAVGATQTFALIWDQVSNGQLVAPGNYEAMGVFVCLNPPPANGPTGAYDIADCTGSGTFPTGTDLTPNLFRSALMPFTITQ